MSRHQIRAILSLTGLATGVSAFAGNVRADELSDLRAQVEALSRRIEQMEAQQSVPLTTPPGGIGQPGATVQAGVQPQGVSGESPTAASFPGSFPLPGLNTQVRVGGFAKMDATYDMDAKGPEALDATALSLKGTPGYNRTGYAHLDAKYSNFNFETRTPTDYGELKTYLEFDFANSSNGTNLNVTSNGYTPRLRHAYGQFGGFLLGQTNSTFRDVVAEPETLDSGNPSGQNIIRQTQIRYTYPINDTFKLLAAVENPETDYSDLNGVKLNSTSDPAGASLNSMPDFVAVLSAEDKNGHLALRGLARQLRLKNGSGVDTSEFGYGVGLSGHLLVFGKDKITGQINYGDGIGRYITDASGEAAVFDPADGSLHTMKAWGGNFGYQHWWTDTLRSNANIGYTRIIVSDLLTKTGIGVANDQLTSGQVNLIWSPVKSIDAGIEYIYAFRSTKGDGNGVQNRILISGKYKF